MDGTKPFGEDVGQCERDKRQNATKSCDGHE